MDFNISHKLSGSLSLNITWKREWGGSLISELDPSAWIRFKMGCLRNGLEFIVGSWTQIGSGYRKFDGRVGARHVWRMST